MPLVHMGTVSRKGSRNVRVSAKELHEVLGKARVATFHDDIRKLQRVLRKRSFDEAKPALKNIRDTINYAESWIFEAEQQRIARRKEKQRAKKLAFIKRHKLQNT